MRYLFPFVGVLALVASPLSASAQTGEEVVASELSTEGPVQLETTGVEGAPAAPPPPRTSDGYTQEEMELRVKRAKLGLIAPAGVLVPGAVLLALGLSGE